METKQQTKHTCGLCGSKKIVCHRIRIIEMKHRLIDDDKVILCDERLEHSDCILRHSEYDEERLLCDDCGASREVFGVDKNWTIKKTKLEQYYEGTTQ